MKKNNFRYDINGLRAYAVSLVVLFHFGVIGFSAGFIGVDIFFVISGFLMTKIIVDQLLEQRFSFLQFYISRAIRILPALMVLTVAIALLGWWLLIPEGYENYAKHAAASITFLSNLIYYLEAGDYFALDTHNKILLHTWSLSVEWQFYILLPLVLWIVCKINKSKKFIAGMVLLATVLSFLLACLIPEKYKVFAFFMIPTRAWEMLAGGLVYLLFHQLSLQPRSRTLLEGAGFALILLSLLVIDEQARWPGILTLIPVLGTMMILISSQQNSWFTRPKILQFLGNTSYSIYLWHWPVIFFSSYLAFSHSALNILLGVALSVFLGWLSYQWIEEPFRQKFSKQKLLSSYSFFIGSTLILLLGYYYIYKTEGVISRAPKSYLDKAAQMEMPSVKNGWCFHDVNDPSVAIAPQGSSCLMGSKHPTAQKALLIGDSFAGHNTPFWDAVGKKMNMNINALTTNWCYPALDDNFTGPRRSRAYQQCEINRHYVRQHLQEYPTIILAAQWNNVMLNEKHRQSFSNFVKLLNDQGKKVIIMDAPYNFDTDIALQFKRALWFDRPFNLKHYLPSMEYKKQIQARQYLEQIATQYSHTLLLHHDDLFPAPQLTENHLPYSSDGSHLSVDGSLNSAHYFMQQKGFTEFKDFLAQ